MAAAALPLRTRESMRARRRRLHSSSVDVVVPVYNEAGTLERSIRRLHDFLGANLPFAWRIVIADNASTDRTWEIAQRLRHEVGGVEAIHLEEKGRGRALRAAWSASDADVLCYMDVDLSTHLSALLPLIAGLLSGHSDVAIGTRRAPGARIVRSRKRELISRAYNLLLRLVLGAQFSDAQCGFKAIRADVARQLLPAVRDESWFFDTELLIQAQRHRLRIHEVAVDWVEDPDSRVDISATVRENLRGTARLLLQLEFVRFAVIGVIMTLAYALLYLMLRVWLSGPLANALGLALTAPVNTQLNRRYTFGVRGRAGLVQQHVAGALVYMLTLALTEGVLLVLHALVARPSHLTEVIVLITASAVATLTRYYALRSWAFGRSRRGGPATSTVGMLLRADDTALLPLRER
jgi:glycosyltransferase involved in cell wall biosynthesis